MPNGEAYLERQPPVLIPHQGTFAYHLSIPQSNWAACKHLRENQCIANGSNRNCYLPDFPSFWHQSQSLVLVQYLQFVLASQGTLQDPMVNASQPTGGSPVRDSIHFMPNFPLWHQPHPASLEQDSHSVMLSQPPSCENNVISWVHLEIDGNYTNRRYSFGTYSMLWPL